MVHRAVDFAVFPAMLETIRQFQRNHVAEVAMMSGNFFLNVAIDNFRLARQRMLGEKMLGEE